MTSVVIIHTGAVGDLVQALPALQAVRGARPSAKVTFVGRPERGTLAQAAGVVNHLRDLETSGLWRFVCAGAEAPCPAWLREADLILDFLTKGEMARRLAAGPVVVTVDPLPPEGWDRSAATYIADQVRQVLGLPSPTGEDRPVLSLDEAAIETGRRVLAARGVDGPFVAIHPGSGAVRKNWPMDRFETVAHRLRRDTGRTVVWLAGPAEAERRTLPTPTETVLPNLSLVEVAAVCALSDAYLGNDSGITQVAAAVSPRRDEKGHPDGPAVSRPRTAVVALFGPTDPQIWAPRGDHVRVVRSPDGTMAGIPVEAAAEALRASLTG